MKNMETIWEAAQAFTPVGAVRAVREHGNGNINDTYLVTVDEADQFVLQRINTHVFTRPELIIKNLRAFIAHVDRRLEAAPADPTRRWDVPHIRGTRAGQDFYLDAEGSFWRAISFVNHSRSFETVQGVAHAREAGYALGKFQSLVSDLSTDTMFDTLEGFHITPQYLQKYDDVMARGPRRADSPEVQYCHRIVAGRREWLTVLEDARAQGKLQVRVIHGDPKINNIMIGDETGLAVSLVDLDTVKPGLVHYDIGDCLRSSCNPLGEDTTDYEAVHFDTDLAEVILEGYISVAREFLTAADYDYMYDSIRLLTFECGLRFFQDYLAGDVYFKVRHPEHNLQRAVVQFKLTESIEAQESTLRQVIAGLTPAVA
jgi:hypothetical protein